VSTFPALLAVIYATIAIWLAAYGLNALVLALLYLRHSGGRDEGSTLRLQSVRPWQFGRPSHCEDSSTPKSFPSVTVQVPVYNERHVIERAIDAVASLDYPRDRLQIQILDDSTDETTRLAHQRAAYHRRRGLDIRVLRRVDRSGFKAGALAFGLHQARGAYVAIFDADFRPHKDFLLQTVPHLLSRPGLGLVQVRWSHLNANYSPLTRAQAIAFDGHFVVEQTARNRSGLLMNFNGTAGVWRKACIIDSGGWQTDTLSEDLDLSYRAQLAGWETLYLPGVDAPAELPPQIAAFKRQQARWAQGSVQTLRKLTGPILNSNRLGVAQKGMALLHLSGYLAHALLVLLLLVTLPLVVLDVAPPTLGNLGLLMGLGPPLIYVLAAQQLYSDWRRHLLGLPLVLLAGVGIAWNNTMAAWRGLTRWGGTFARTPKFRVEDEPGGEARQWRGSSYRLGVDRSVIGEVALTLYAVASSLVAISSGRYAMLPFLLLCAAAFGTVGGLELAQAVWVRPRHNAKAHPVSQ
jgi:cellulose synthase/poly-beta-1,6-N-acetylglucosamine synthase-like glycosyltransferase